MVLVELPMGIVLLISFNAGLCSVDIWSILVCISWCPLWVLATNSFSWLIPLSSVVLDISYPLSRDFLLESFSWSSCCLEHILFYLHIQFLLLPMLVYLSFPILEPLLFPWCYSSWFPQLHSVYPLLFSFLALWSLLSFFLSIVDPWVVGHPCCPLSYLPDPFLKECPSLCLSFPVYASMLL